jgi:hypothetical protein
MRLAGQHVSACRFVLGKRAAVPRDYMLIYRDKLWAIGHN